MTDGPAWEHDNRGIDLSYGGEIRIHVANKSWLRYLEKLLAWFSYWYLQ